jgi:VWFA-related protein
MKAAIRLATAFVVFQTGGWTQQPPAPPPPEQTGEPPIRVLVEEVTVPFIVTDNRNRLITNLTKADFQVLEDKKPQTISDFAQQTDVPVRIGLLLDTSNSIRDRMDFEQRAAADFLRTTLRPGMDKALLGSFDSVAELVQDFTDDLDKLVTAIGTLRAGGGTALYDAILFATRDRLLEEAPLNSNFRRALVVLSDGEDNQSRFTRSQTMENARRAEVIIYTISTNIRGTALPGDKVLKEFAEETGGRFFQPFTWDDLDEAFQAISTELRSQYTISYNPTTPRDGKYHEIEIRPVKSGLKVRARRGYFAAPSSGASGPASQTVPPPSSSSFRP